MSAYATYACARAYNGGGCSNTTTTTNQYASCPSCGSHVVLVQAKELDGRDRER
jgi:DNA-directed RNA polymerase subunit RPC12/RpoP